MTTRHEDWAAESADWVADAGATVAAVDDSSRDARAAQLPGMLLSTTLGALLRFADCPVMVIPETHKGGDGDG
jgi:hypothetical protein